MKSYKIIFLLLFAINLHAQSGIVTYHGELNKKYVDSVLAALPTRDIPESSKKFISDNYHNAYPVEYVLKFDKEKAFYYFKPSLRDEEGYNDTKATIHSDPFYTNTSTDSIIEFNRFVGNVKYESPEWKITNETKKIGNYTCRKAVASERLFSRQGHYYYEPVTAWFTTDIPAHFAPKYYSGLPGLVLEIEKEQYTVTATEIILNPKEKVVLDIPKYKRVISINTMYKRYEERANERKKEMQNKN